MFRPVKTNQKIAEAALDFATKYIKKSSTRLIRGVEGDDKREAISKGKWVIKAEQELDQFKHLIALVGGEEIAKSENITFEVVGEGEIKKTTYDEIVALETKLAALSKEERDNCKEAYLHYEMLCHSIHEEVRELECLEDPAEVDYDKSGSFADFSNGIDVAKKFSIGNCHELCTLSLYYILVHEPDIHAEFLEIADPFDHCLVVIERENDKTTLQSIRSWNSKTTISDPWYKIACSPKSYEDFLTKKGYEAGKQEITVTYTTEFLKTRNNPENVNPILDQYIKKLTHIHDALSILRTRFIFLLKELEPKKRSNFRKKIQTLDALQRSIVEMILQGEKHVTNNRFNYWKIRADFKENLHQVIKQSNSLLSHFPASLQKEHEKLITHTCHQFHASMKLLNSCIKNNSAGKLAGNLVVFRQTLNKFEKNTKHHPVRTDISKKFTI